MDLQGASCIIRDTAGLRRLDGTNGISAMISASANGAEVTTAVVPVTAAVDEIEKEGMRRAR